MSLIKIVVITLVLREIVGIYGVLVMLYYFTCTSWNSFLRIFEYFKTFEIRRIKFNEPKSLEEKIENKWTLL